MLFMGTMITQGNGQGVVIGTGMNTEMGKIAAFASDNGDFSDTTST